MDEFNPVHFPKSSYLKDNFNSEQMDFVCQTATWHKFIEPSDFTHMRVHTHTHTVVNLK
jgi:hypothetical protein